MSANNLMKDLAKIAASELRVTRCIPRHLKFKFELMGDAYGEADIRDDFRNWCRDHVGEQVKYPIFDYLKVIDSRLGSAPVEDAANIADPHVQELISLAYELTNLLPAKKAVAEVLLAYPFDEVKAALTEYTENLTEKDVKGGMRAFWSEGSAGAVILARRRRANVR